MELKLSKGIMARLYVLAFMAGTSVGIWYFLPYFIIDLKGGMIEVGLISTFPYLVDAIIQQQVGTVIEEMKATKDLLVLGFILSSFFAIPLSFSSTALVAILLATLLYLFSSITESWGVANSIYMANLTPAKSRARIMSVYSSSCFLGNILGSFLAGYLAPISWHIVFLIFAGMNVASGIFLHYFLPDETLKGTTYWAIIRSLFDFRKFLRVLEKLPALIKEGPKEYVHFCIAVSIRSIGVSMVSPITAVYLAEVLHASKPVIAVLTSVNTLARIILSPPMGWIADRWGRKKVFILGLIMMMVYPIIFVSAQDVNLLYPAYLMMGLGWACSQATWLAWQMELIPRQKGILIGVLQFMNNIGWATGPSIGGFLGQYAGIWWGVGLTTLVESIGLLLLMKVPERASNV